MNKFKIIIGYLLGFVFSISLAVLILLFIFKFTLGRKEYLYEAINKNNYYEKIYNEIKEEMENTLLSSGFTNDIIEDIYTKEEVTNDIDYFIENLYNGKKTVLNKTNIKEKLEKKVKVFFATNNFEILNQKDLDSFINDLVDVYENEICLYEYIDNYVNQFYKINTIVNKLVIIIAVVCVILLLILIFMKNKYISSSIMASGFIILFIELFIFEKIDIESILIITENFSYLIEDILLHINDLFYITGILTVIIGLILSLVKISVKQKRKKRLEY